MIDRVWERIRNLQYNMQSEESYAYWIRFFKWPQLRHPHEMAADVVRIVFIFW